MLRLIHTLQRASSSASVVGLLAFAAVAAPVAVAPAQSAPIAREPMPLSLDDAVRRGMQRNEDIGIARAQLRGAMAQRGAARSAFMPHLTSQTSYARTLRGPFSEIGPSSGDAAGQIEPLLDDLVGRKNTYAHTLGATQLVFDREALANVRVAQQAEQVQELQLTERELDVTLQIMQA